MITYWRACNIDAAGAGAATGDVTGAGVLFILFDTTVPTISVVLSCLF
jgi:hypothetical protein